MKNKFVTILLAAVVLVGCAPPTSEEIAGQQAENTENSNKPQLIASTPQGNLYLIFVRPFPKNNIQYDRIYFFDTNKTVTINSDHTQGKTTVTEAMVIVNGKEYVPKKWFFSKNLLTAPLNLLIWSRHMNAKVIEKQVSTLFRFEIEFDGKKYNATIILGPKGRFFGESVEHADTNIELGHEGTEGDIRESIVDFIDKNWEMLTKQS